MTLTTFVKTNLKKDFSNRKEILNRAIKEMHATPKQFSNVISDINRRSGWNNYPNKAGRGSKVEINTDIQVERKIGISIDQFRKKHDIFHIVSEAARKLKKDVFLTESEFVQVNGIRMVGYRDALGLPENSKYKGKAGSTIYWSHPDTIRQMKSEGTLI
jgi:hypothetical protein